MDPHFAIHRAEFPNFAGAKLGKAEAARPSILFEKRQNVG